jgi:hypothetical protein
MMLDFVSLLVSEAGLFQTSNTHDAAPRSGLNWGLLGPFIFTLNVVVAILAWFLVELFVRLI